MLSTTSRALRRGTVAATQRAIAVLRAQGFDARIVRDEIDGADHCALEIEGLDEVTISASCAEDEPDSAWRVIASIPGDPYGMELADVELRDLTRTSAPELVVRRIMPYLSMTRPELSDLA
jgi:hypothetical protein